MGIGIRSTWPGVVLGVYTHTYWPSRMIASPFGSLKRIVSLFCPDCTMTPWLSNVPTASSSITCLKSARRDERLRYTFAARPTMALASSWVAGADQPARADTMARLKSNFTRIPQLARECRDRWPRR